MVGWATEEFGLEHPSVEVAFNKELNRYDFNW